jgi:hypothetical protein
MTEIEEIVARALRHLAGSGGARALVVQRILSALDAAGYAVVKKEPSDEVVILGDTEAIDVLNDHTFALKEPTLAERVYRAMISAQSGREG